MFAPTSTDPNSRPVKFVTKAKHLTNPVIYV